MNVGTRRGRIPSGTPTPGTEHEGLAAPRVSLQDDEGALALIGGTPLVCLGRISPEGGATVYAKAEFKNPGGSIKDRPALNMVLAAEREGRLGPGSTIVEATSGNTGISLAMIAARRGYKCMLVMPEDMSLERRHILPSYGADIVLTPAPAGMMGAVKRAPVIVPPVPTPATKASSAPPVCSRISGAVPRS